MDHTVDGGIELKISDECTDHHSLMQLFKAAVLAQWGIKEGEYWEMIQEHLLLTCPDGCLWPTLREARGF